MIIPLHLLPDSHHQAMPHYTLDGLTLDPALRPQAPALELASPIIGPVDAADLQRFTALMAQEGLPLQPTRMFYDRLYAFERLAQGFGSSNAALRDLSVDLCADYQQAGEWIGLIH